MDFYMERSSSYDSSAKEEAHFKDGLNHSPLVDTTDIDSEGLEELSGGCGLQMESGDEESLPFTAKDASDKIKLESIEDDFQWTAMKDEVIHLSDSDDVATTEQGFGKTTHKGSFVISEDDDEGDVLMLDGERIVPIKKEPQDVQILWSYTGSQVIDLEDSDKEQQSCSSKSNIRNIPTKRQRSKGRAPRLEVIRGNDTNIVEDTKPDFLILMREYKKKKQQHRNTLEDDILFKKAQKAEKKRINTRNHDMAYGSSSDEDNESEDGLFVSQEYPTSSASKRPISSIIEDDEDDSLDDLSQKPPAKKIKRCKVLNNVAIPTKRSRAKAKEAELYANMSAGIEAIRLQNQLKELEAEEAQRRISEPKKRGKKKTAGLSARRNKAGRVSNIGSLMTSNVYDESNANLDKAALPVISGTNKKEFLAELIAEIPLDDKRQARSDKVDLDNAAKTLWPRRILPDDKGGWSVPGMSSSLYHYQVQGAAAMKAREIGDQAPFGGILADQMGLGKTVMMIATMIANQQSDPDGPKCTLIVCPPALMGQWEREFKKHVEPGCFPTIIHRHHGGTKYCGSGAEVEMANAHVVLTSYSEVLRSYPKCLIPEERKQLTEKEEWWKNHWESNRDLLHKAHFYRVVLDEAHAIKNHTSQTSIACRALMAKHRWAISGTPIQNRLEELFPYFKFLRLKFAGSIDLFRRNFCLKDSDVCNVRLVSVISGMMIRRVHADRFMGAPLVVLPRIHNETISLKFNKVEQHLYDFVSKKCINAINRASRDDNVDNRRKIVLMMISRLRQMVAHVFSAQQVLQKHFDMDMVNAMWSDLDLDNEAGDKAERLMMTRFERMIQSRGDELEDPAVDALFGTEQAKLSKGRRKKSTLRERFGRYLSDLKKKGEHFQHRQLCVCQSCGQPPENAHVTSCYHVFCSNCLLRSAYDASHMEEDRTECRKCGQTFEEAVSCSTLKELKILDLSATIYQTKKDTPEVKPRFKLTMEYVDSEDELVFSAKVAAVRKKVKEWMQEDAGKKIILFTEWLMIGHLLGRVCQQEGWESCHYNGKMSLKAREESICTFQDDPALKIMIASLKCGGTGLNLTVACRVISVDLWFNSYVEQQAFCRVHRIGQLNSTYISRFRVENTIDDRLLLMQEEKRGTISAVMDNRAVLSQLDLTDLMKLFGPVVYDENSKPFIVVDDEAGMPKTNRSSESA